MVTAPYWAETPYCKKENTRTLLKGHESDITSDITKWYNERNIV